jgi:drug/metabolite transporter (DMT)-like permease
MRCGAEPAPQKRRYGLGAAAGAGAAVLFGVSAPIAKLLLPGTSPWLLGGLLYLGAGLGLSIIRVGSARQRNGRPDRLQRGDLPLLAAIIVSGGVAGPVLLMIGLTRVSGVVGSLLLNLEAVFTILLAIALFGERLRVGEAIGAALTVAGAVLLTGPAPPLTQTGSGSTLGNRTCPRVLTHTNSHQRTSDSMTSATSISVGASS